MQEILKQYRRLLESIDSWFDQAQLQFPQAIQCRTGCSGCCRGFFDITLLDAALIDKGFKQLTAVQRDIIRNRSILRLEELKQRWPGFASPYLLNKMPDYEWTEMPETDETPCPFLGDDHLCQVYAFRPMTCRLHGLPNIDISGESFSDDFCTLNFQGLDPLTLTQLRWEFRQTFAKELELFQLYTKQLFDRPMNELDTLLPLVPLIDFDEIDWRNITFYTLPVSLESIE